MKRYQTYVTSEPFDRKVVKGPAAHALDVHGEVSLVFSEGALRVASSGNVCSFSSVESGTWEAGIGVQIPSIFL